jgi:hypothetical protein
VDLDLIAKQGARLRLVAHENARSRSRGNEALR